MTTTAPTDPAAPSGSLQRCGAGLVRQFRRQPDASARTLLVTVFGDSVRPHGGEIATGGLARLVEPLGISDRLVRTSLNRLVREGLLVTRRAGRRSFYSVTPAAEREFASVEDRIYHRRREPWDGRWTIAVETAGLAATPARAELRRRLGWLGFAALSPGVQVSPADRRDDLGLVLDDLGLSGQVAAFRGEVDGIGLDDRALARRTSDLDSLAPAYEAFLRRYEPLAASGGSDGIDPETAFLARTLLLHGWRRVALREPALPLQLWPDGWVGDRAYDLAAGLYRRLSPAAETHLSSVCAATGDTLPALHRRFAGRFPPR